MNVLVYEDANFRITADPRNWQGTLLVLRREGSGWVEMSGVTAIELRLEAASPPTLKVETVGVLSNLTSSGR